MVLDLVGDTLYKNPKESLLVSPVVSSKDECKRLFKSDFMEFFTRVRWSTPLILYVPLVSYCLYRAWSLPTRPVGLIIGYFFFGLLCWSLVEYFLHRFVFHFKPRANLFKRIFYLIHEVHHEYPNDSLRLVMPPIESVPLAVIFYFGLNTLLPNKVFFPYFAGLVLGYLVYDMVHYSVHHLPLKSRAGQYFKKHHVRHHFQEEDRGFGVSSPWWDRVFGTQFSRKST